MAFSAPIDPQFNQELRTLLEERQEELFETFSPPESRANSQGSTENVSEDCIRHDANDDEDDSDEDEPLTEADPTELARFYSQTHPEMVHEDDHREDDDDLDKSSVEAVFRTGCGCKHQCYTNFSVDRVWEYRLNMSEFQKDQLDVLVLAKLEQCEVQGEPIRGGKRERQFFDYVFDGHRTCEKV
ncbi:uncharacterized protein [Ptychodera flava]|uniref:uncharacterized protein n=1 Tax=Ptychodera flava TaxID=63121 RepID=UPI00396AAD1B